MIILLFLKNTYFLPIAVGERLNGLGNGENIYVLKSLQNIQGKQTE